MKAQERLAAARLIGGLLALVGGLLLGTGVAQANGTPIKVVLSYLQGVSNFGPTGATGVADLVTKEGEVRVTTTGLPRLQGEEYHVWLVNNTTRERLSLGAFNVGTDGVGKL